MSRYCILICAYLSLASLTLAAPRTWTSADGQSKLEATAMAYDGKLVTLSISGKGTKKVAVTFFSDEDQSWLESNKNNLGNKPQKAPELCTVAKETAHATTLLVEGSFEKKPPKNAAFYVILYSASWCGPCRGEMPKIGKIYDEKFAKSEEVEFILLSRDKGDDAAKNWAKSAKTTFPIIMPADTKKKGDTLNKLPGVNGIPHMKLITGNGEVVAEGHPANLIGNLDSIIAKHKEAKGSQ